MRTAAAAVAAPAVAAVLAVAAILAVTPAALAAPGRTADTASTASPASTARTASPAFTNPGNASPSLSFAVSPGGEPEVASVGKGGSLWFTVKTGGHWHRTEVARSGAAQSGPSLDAGQGGTAFIAVEGPHHTLQYYFLVGSHWSHDQVAGNGSAYSTPSLAQGSSETGIAVQGPSHSLWLYKLSAGHWHKKAINSNGTAFSAPSIVIRDDAQATATDPAGEIDIAVENDGNSLSYYRSLPGGDWQNDVIGTPGTTFSAPSLMVIAGTNRTTNQGSPFVAVQGASHTLLIFADPEGTGWVSETREGQGWVYSAPSITQGDAYTSDLVAFQGSGHSMVLTFFNVTDRTWQNDPVATTVTSYSAPVVVLRPSHSLGESDIVVQGHGNTLQYFDAGIPAAGHAPSFTRTQIAGPGTIFGG